MLKTALDGQRFGKLTVVDQEFAYRLMPSGRRRLVLCACECGRERPVLVTNLRSGNTTNCGESLCSTRGDSLRKLYGYLKPGDQARNYIFLNYQSTARQRGRVWEISFERFCDLTARDCSYCGAAPANRTKDRNGDGVFTYNGLDRVDPSRGYTTDNVVPACIVCNRAKTDMSREEFHAWVGRVHSRTRR